jgi:hypothetical protein
MRLLDAGDNKTHLKKPKPKTKENPLVPSRRENEQQDKGFSALFELYRRNKQQ